MKQFSYVITDETGIHARPAGLLVQEAQKFSSEVTLSTEGKTASVKKLFALMGLGVKQHQEVTISVEGDDEEEAVEALESFFVSNL